MNDYHKKVLKSLNNRPLQGRRSRDKKIGDFYDANKDKLEDGMREMAMRQGLSGNDAREVFIKQVKARIEDSDKTKKALEIVDTALDEGILSSERANILKEKIHKRNIDTISSQDLKNAIQKTVLHDAMRGEMGMGNFMKGWFGIYDPEGNGTGRRGRGGKASEALKKFREDTGWTGSTDDYDNIEWDSSYSSSLTQEALDKTKESGGKKVYTSRSGGAVIYTGKDGKRWRLFIRNSPTIADYEEV